MALNPSVFKAYDIRGVYPSQLDEEGVRDITRGIYTFLKRSMKKDRLTITIGRDMRLSSPSLREVVAEELKKMGAQVYDMGLVTTPTIYFSVKNYGYDAGIQISASHNPKEYNGLKVVRAKGDILEKIGKTTGMDEVKRITLEKDFEPYMEGGEVHDKPNVIVEEVQAAIDLVKPTHIKKFKVVSDAANAMGAVYITELFKHIPCELVKMNFELDGTFPVHQADPLQFKLHVDLQKKVVEEKADLGIAPDGDGDRVFFIDEKGQIIPATMISSLITKEILTREKNARVLVDVRYTKNVSNIGKKYGGEILYSRVGHALITEQLNNEHAAFAGESSGHFYFRESGGCENAIRVVLYILEAMGRENKTISELVAGVHSSYESGEYNFELLEGNNPKDLMEEIGKMHSEGKVSWLDGISVDYPEWRLNIRSSNTEPLLRLNVEADTQEIMQAKLKELIDFILSKGAHAKE